MIFEAPKEYHERDWQLTMWFANREDTNGLLLKDEVLE